MFTGLNLKAPLLKTICFLEIEYVAQEDLKLGILRAQLPESWRIWLPTLIFIYA